MKMMVDTVVTEADRTGLKINTTKTEIMKFRAQDAQSVSIGSSNLREVNNFVCLGYRLSNDGDIRTDINIRIAKHPAPSNV